MTIKIKTISIIVSIIVASFAIIAGIISFEKYFAKSEEVKEDIKLVNEKFEENDQLLSERLDISIINDDIRYEQQQIQRVKIGGKIEKRELTDTEKEMVKIKEQELSRLRAERLEKKKIH